MLDDNSIIIVGAGQSGGWAAKTLRDNGFSGSIVLVGEESHLPYERPPLSKDVLLGRIEPGACQLWSSERLNELQIQTELGVRVDQIDRDARQVVCEGGKRLRYDQLLLAMGTRPRKLDCEGAGLNGVHYLRTIDDCLSIRASLSPTTRLVVLGGGWIGLEVAAGMRARGMHVTVLEAANQLCGRSLPSSLGQFFLKQHQEHGVDVQLGVRVKRIIGTDKVQGVELEDGTRLEASVVVVGIGAIPNDELARSCGLEVGNGIMVDEHCRTSDSRIFACGDVTNQPFGQGRIRLESWKNAQDQGVAVAKVMLGIEPGARDLPWFWSDQFDMNFQLLGMIPAGARQYRKPNASGSGFVDLFLEEGRVVAAAAVNSPRELREAKKAIQKALPYAVDDLTLV